MSDKPKDSSDLASKVSELEGKLRKVERRMKGYGGALGRIQKGKFDTKQETSVNEAETPETEPSEPPKPHDVAPWQQYCTDCGGKNPEFQDETKCDGCGMHTGAVQTAIKMQLCPSCDQTNKKDEGGKLKSVFWSPLDDGAKQKIIEMLKVGK